jgi:hypothetical protein
MGWEMGRQKYNVHEWFIYMVIGKIQLDKITVHRFRVKDKEGIKDPKSSLHYPLRSVGSTSRRPEPGVVKILIMGPLTFILFLFFFWV